MPPLLTPPFDGELASSFLWRSRCFLDTWRPFRPGMNPGSAVQDGMEDATVQKCFSAKVDPQLM